LPPPDVPLTGLEGLEPLPVGVGSGLPLGVGVVGCVEGCVEDGVVGSVDDHGALGLGDVQGVVGEGDVQVVDGLGELHDELGVEGRLLLGHVDGRLLGDVHG
jgi:hypothetical protein